MDRSIRSVSEAAQRMNRRPSLSPEADQLAGFAKDVNRTEEDQSLTRRCITSGTGIGARKGHRRAHADREKRRPRRRPPFIPCVTGQATRRGR